MPSARTKKTKKSAPTRKKFKNIPQNNHRIFWPLVLLVLLLWLLYRAIFTFPVWFDESIGKLIFFGFPVWFYVTITKFKPVLNSLSVYKLHRGLLLGLAYGGIFGFAGAIAALAFKGGTPQELALYSSPEFWGEFMLGLLTAFWESIFFFAFVMSGIMHLYKHWSLLKQVLLTAFIFGIFHFPNNFLRYDLRTAVATSLLMFAFGIGQALLFSKEKNTIALVLSHTLWGMVLLVHWA
jgi:hypothetical protein